MDSQSGLCSGCFRTLEEIENWLKYTGEERKRITTALNIRQELLSELNNHGESSCLPKLD